MSAHQAAFDFSAEVNGHSLPASTFPAVYVDECVWPFGRMMMCHMLADRVEDLHAMADKIGIARRWFQNDRYPHYDICKSKRASAVKLGAKEIGRREFVDLAKRLMTQEGRSTKLALQSPEKLNIGAGTGSENQKSVKGFTLGAQNQ